MLSYDDQLQQLRDGDEQIRILTAGINDPSVNDEKKLQYRRQRAVANYERKKWHDLLLDIQFFEQKNDSSFGFLKLKATIHEYFRKTRASIAQMMDTEDYTSEYDGLFVNISEANIERLIDGKSITKPKASRK